MSLFSLAKGKIKFYTLDEVVIHNKPDDIWVVINRRVLNLNPFFKNKDELYSKALKQLIAYAGKDISKFFDESGFPKTRISMNTGHIVPVLWSTIELTSSTNKGTPDIFWWNDPTYQIGMITCQERKIRIINTLTTWSTVMSVCEEDTIRDIQEKYREKYNHHCGSYTWRKKGRQKNKKSGRLFLNKTLTENGILMENPSHGIPPALWLFYNDDMTIG